MDSETIQLLDKLYDLRKDDSSILIAIENEKKENIAKKDELTEKKSELETKISLYSNELEILDAEGNDLKSTLLSLGSDRFLNVLRTLDIEFNPSALVKEINQKLPETLSEIDSTKTEAEKNLQDTEEELANVIVKIEELGIRHDEIVSNQVRLNHYFDLALSSDVNITRDEITSLLQIFGLDEKEQRQAAKLLMFPEDALLEYDNSKNRRPMSSKSISDIIQSAKKNENESPVVSDPVVMDTKPEDEIIPSIIEPEDLITSDEIIRQVPKTTKENLIEVLKDNNIDYLDFTTNDFDKMLNNFDKDIFNKNISIINKYGIQSDIFADNVELFYDPELGDKIALLIGTGKEVQDIYYNPNVLIKYNLENLQKAIDTLTENGLDPKDIPLMAY